MRWRGLMGNSKPITGAWGVFCGWGFQPRGLAGKNTVKFC